MFEKIHTIKTFHCSVNLGISKETFAGKLQVGDQIVTSQEDKQDAVLDFYDNLLGSTEDRDYTIDLAALHIQQHDLASHDEPFLEEEAWETTKGMPLDKAPGPDGFTGHFLAPVGTL